MPRWVKALVIKSDSLSLIPRMYLVWGNNWPLLALLLALLARRRAWVPTHLNNKQLLKYSAFWLEPPSHNLYGFGTELTEVTGNEDTPNIHTKKKPGISWVMHSDRGTWAAWKLSTFATRSWWGVHLPWWGGEYIFYRWQEGGTFYAADAEGGLANLASRHLSMRAVLGFSHTGRENWDRYVLTHSQHHTWTKGRPWHSSESDLGKVLPLPRGWCPWQGDDQNCTPPRTSLFCALCRGEMLGFQRQNDPGLSSVTWQPVLMHAAIPPSILAMSGKPCEMDYPGWSSALPAKWTASETSKQETGTFSAKGS